MFKLIWYMCVGKFYFFTILLGKFWKCVCVRMYNVLFFDKHNLWSTAKFFYIPKLPSTFTRNELRSLPALLKVKCRTSEVRKNNLRWKAAKAASKWLYSCSPTKKGGQAHNSNLIIIVLGLYYRNINVSFNKCLWFKWRLR